MKKNGLAIEFCGVTFPNPFVLAAAPPTDSAEMIARGFDAGWGGAVVKTLGLEDHCWYRVSLRDESKEKFIDEPERWRLAEAALVSACEGIGLST